MFKANQKTAFKLSRILETNIDYEIGQKLFHGITNKNITADQIKKIERLGLIVHSLTIEGIRRDGVDFTDSINIVFKRKSIKPALLIGVLSFQVVMFGIEFLYLGTHTFKP